MFSVGRMWPQLPSCFRNAMKGVACVQTSVPFKNLIKYLVYKKLCTLTQVYRFQCFRGTCSLIVAASKWEKIVMRVRTERMARNKNEDREPKSSHYPMKFMARSISTKEEQRLAKQRNRWLSRETTISLLQWGVWNLAHFLELFQHTLSCPHTLLHMADCPKSTCHTNSNVHGQFEIYWDVRARHTV